MHDVRTALFASLSTILILCVVSITLSRPVISAESVLIVAFLDVGQGDATFIESPSGTQVLIDGGRDSSVLGGLEKQMGYFDTDIDMIVATHPDADHITGLIDVLKRYDVETVLMTENKADTPVYKAFIKSVAEEGAIVRYARAGQVYVLGVGQAGTSTLTVFFPDRDPTNLESNTSSIIAQLSYGDIDYMLTGDSPSQIEEYLVGKHGVSLASEVLKVGHHGSKTSSAEAFVSAVSPMYAVISAGKDNSYGHPHEDVVSRFEAHGVRQKNTADEGTITSITNGIDIWFE